MLIHQVMPKNTQHVAEVHVLHLGKSALRVHHFPDEGETCIRRYWQGDLQLSLLAVGLQADLYVRFVLGEVCHVNVLHQDIEQELHMFVHAGLDAVVRHPEQLQLILHRSTLQDADNVLAQVTVDVNQCSCNALFLGTDVVSGALASITSQSIK